MFKGVKVIRTIYIDPTQLDKNPNNKIYLRQLLLNSKQNYWMTRTGYSIDDKPTGETIAILLVKYNIVCRSRNSENYCKYFKAMQNNKEKSYDDYRFEVYSDEDRLGEGGQASVYKIRGTIAINKDDIQFKSETKSGYKRVIKKSVFPSNKNSYAKQLTIEEFDKINLLKQNYIHAKPPVIYSSFLIDYCFTVMRKLPGETLSHYLKSNPLLTMAQRICLSIAFLKALKLLHDSGVIHRDIKPDNIMVDSSNPSDPQVAIIDFGFAQAEQMLKAEKTPLLGTLGYMSPEVIKGEGCSRSSDEFAAGRVIGVILNADDPNKFIYKLLKKAEYFFNPKSFYKNIKMVSAVTTAYKYDSSNKIFSDIDGPLGIKARIKIMLSELNQDHPSFRPQLSYVIEQFENYYTELLDDQKSSLRLV